MDTHMHLEMNDVISSASNRETVGFGDYRAPLQVLLLTSLADYE